MLIYVEGFTIMSIKAVVKEHFSHSPISRHLNKHFLNAQEITIKNTNWEDINLELRRFSSDDVFQCVELFMRVFSSDPWFDNWLSFDYVNDYLNELILNPVFMGFVAREDSGEIAAVCFGHKKSWWMGKEFIIDEFYVKNDRQGKGIGSLLMDYMVDILSENDYKRLILTTNRNIPAQWFYIKNGFVNNENRVVMIKEI